MSDKIKKWRDSLVDPMDIPFKNIKINKIISYPYAGNDVFECIGIYKDKKVNFFIKLERSKLANFDNEVYILNLVKDKFPVPIVYESGVYNNCKYIVLSKLKGDKLSSILKNTNDSSMDYLYSYGLMLGSIHSLSIKADKAMQRSINDYPNKEKYNDLSSLEEKIINYLIVNKPNIVFDVFIHGDFHYANILWHNKKITGILDFEYAGIGFKEQDIAWSIILRPNQEFLYTIKEIKEFLRGYNSIGSYDFNKLKWCLINGYMHFYLMNRKSNNKIYLNRLKRLINYFIKKSSL